MTEDFTGTHVGPLDEKNRVVLPLRFRQVLSEARREAGFVVTLGFNGNLLMFPRARWDALIAKIRKLPFTDPTAALFQRFFLSFAQEAPIDKVGRLTIADFQREICNIGREVIFKGVGAHIEIWSDANWKKHFEEAYSQYGPAAAKFLELGGLPENQDETELKG